MADPFDSASHRHQDNCSIFSVEVAIAKRSGEGFSDSAKNLYVLGVDVTIPLEFTHLSIPF